MLEASKVTNIRGPFISNEAIFLGKIRDLRHLESSQDFLWLNLWTLKMVNTSDG